MASWRVVVLPVVAALLNCHPALAERGSRASTGSHITPELRKRLPVSIPRRPDRSGVFPRNSTAALSIIVPGAPDRLDACTPVLTAAERRYGIPTGLLLAIGMVETGRLHPVTRRIQPWPWSANALGQGAVFATSGQAVDWVRQKQASGIQSIDVGCAQVNLMYHPQAFRTLEAAFSPAINADYAARFLLSLFRTSGDWATATGWYHSQTASRADAYRAQVQAAFTRTVLNRRQHILEAMASAWQATIPNRDVDRTALPKLAAGNAE